MSKKKTSPAAKFLLIITGLIVLLLIAGVLFNKNQETLLRFAFVPSHTLESETMAEASDYALPQAWAVRPGAPNEADSLPEGIMQIAQVPEVDVFFVHPTTFLNKERWNANYTADEETETRLHHFVLKHQASVFNMAGRIYAPRYRQATFGAFLDETGQGAEAVMRAHTDVLNAFDHYMRHDNAGRPFILAGHSQGALHALMLLAERIVPMGLTDQMIAAYIIGWPVSVDTDIVPLTGLTACERPDDTGCIISYLSFGPEGNVAPMKALFDSSTGFSGDPRKGTQILCTNPLNWQIDQAAPRTGNLGGLPLTMGKTPLPAVVPALTGARCGEDGFLYLTEPPQGEWRQYVMAGENYHAYDYNLFYMNIRENAALRAKAWLNAHRADLP